MVVLKLMWYLSLLYLFCRSQGEECDDMNKINGDGCSLFCRQEVSFNCIGESLSFPCTWLEKWTVRNPWPVTVTATVRTKWWFTPSLYKCERSAPSEPAAVWGTREYRSENYQRADVSLPLVAYVPRGDSDDWYLSGDLTLPYTHYCFSSYQLSRMIVSIDF